MELRGPFPPGTNMQRPERGLSRVAVLGSPKVIHDGSRLTFSLRKAQALLLYLAVEKGLHPRSKLAALLWLDSESHTARAALRYALTLLCSRLNASPVAHSHLLIQQDVLGLNPQAPLDLDLDVVQQAWREALRLSTVPDEPQRTALVAQVQHALSLVRGPFLDGFWLREEAPLMRGRSSNNGSGRYACCCCTIGSPAGRRPPGNWNTSGLSSCAAGLRRLPGAPGRGVAGRAVGGHPGRVHSYHCGSPPKESLAMPSRRGKSATKRSYRATGRTGLDFHPAGQLLPASATGAAPGRAAGR